MYFWAIVYVISTTLVAIFKKDNSLSIVENEKEIDMNVKQSYQLLWEILKLEPVRQMALILLTCKVSFPKEITKSCRFLFYFYLKN